MTTVDQILSAAKALPPIERAKLLAALWDDVASSDWIPPDYEWVTEANRRSDAFDSGEMSGSSWAEVRERARREAGLDG